jgi:hypothetical protein
LLILFSPLLGTITLAQPSDNPLSLRWAKGVVKTHVGPLAADLTGDGFMEIVVSGLDSAGKGCVVALDRFGNELWRYYDSALTSLEFGVHSPIEIADLTNDGKMEIVVSANYTFALFGNGSLYWKNTDALSYQNFNAILDIDGDGYPEIFISSGEAPRLGSDRITRLSYDGNIEMQSWAWHVCWGGITIGDTNSDGRFTIFQSDRRATFNPSGDLYKGGGMGIRALDAHTLQPLWNDPTVLCSSHNPILADVDKDGILDVIVVDQSNNGVAVYNSADGSVLTTGGIYRKGSTDTRAHSQPTVADVNGDGNLNLISCREYSIVRIWDLYNWKLEAAGLNITFGNSDKIGTFVRANEPPKVGDVTGDGKLDIVVVSDNEIYVFTYENGEYVQVGYYAASRWDLNALTLIQDLDGDGRNELIVTSMNGWIYVFNTLGKSETPIRSNIHFYSEHRLGSTEYIPPPIPDKPVIREEAPRNKAINTTFNPILSVTAVNFQQNLMDITFSIYTPDSWQDIRKFEAVGNGRFEVATNGIDKVREIYYWRVTAVDLETLDVTEKTYSFTTRSNTPTHDNPLLKESGGYLVCSAQDTSDIDGDKVTNIYNWYVNGQSFTNLNLPFDSRTTNDKLSPETIFHDGFEDGFNKWTGGATNWVRDTNQKYSGKYSALAGESTSSLTSSNIDTSSSQGITVSFWYRLTNVNQRQAFLQFWDGSAYVDIFDIGRTTRKGEWQLYQIQTYDRNFLRQDFRIRFDPRAISGAGSLWVDDVSVTTTPRTFDYSGYDNHATIHGATWSPDGVVGGALAFDGSKDYLVVPDDSSLGGDGSWSEISVEFWLKVNGYKNGVRIVSKQVPYDSVGSYMVGFQTSGTSNRLFWLVRTSDGQQEVTSNQRILPGDWYHIVCTYKSGVGLRIYVNGTQTASSLVSGNIARSPSWSESIHGAPLFIGYDGGYDDSNPARRFLDGFLDEVRIYPIALSAKQSSQRFNETRNGLSDSSSIVVEDANAGVWTCKVTPNDGLGDGETKQSNALIIGHKLSINVEGLGTTNPASGDHFYKEGYNVSVSAFPSSGWALSHWLLNDVNVGSDNPYNLTMNGDYSLIAVFVATVKYNLAIGVSGSGTTDPVPDDYTYGEGTEVSVSALPSSGWTLNHWLLNDTDVGSSNPYNLTMNADYNLTAVFVEVSVVFVDGFESGDLVQWSGVGTWGGASAPIVTSDSPHHGSFSAKSVVSGGQSSFVYKNFADQSTVYARAYHMWNVNPSTNTEGRLVWVLGSGGVIAIGGVRNNGGVLQFYLRYLKNGAYVTVNYNYDFLPNRYYCVELYVRVHGSSGKAALYVDGVELLRDSDFDSNDRGNVSQVRVGLDWGFAQSWAHQHFWDCVEVANAVYIGAESSVLYSLNVGVSGSGATDPVAGVYTYDAGSSVFVSAIADSGWVFSYWLLNGSDVGSANPYSLTMDANYNLTAVFTETSLIFVDGFESGDLVQWSGVGTWGGAAAPVVESVNPHHGTYNAKSVVSAGQSSFVYKNIDVQSVVYARAYHMWSVNPSAGAESRLVWVFGPGGLIAIGGVRNNNGVLQFYMRYLKNGAYVTLNYNYDFSASKYYSIELYVKVDATGGEAALYIDGVKVLEDSDFGNDDRGSVTQVRVGVDWGSAIGQSWAHEHYWDCVEVSNTYIGAESFLQCNLTVGVSGSGSTDPAVGSYVFDEGGVVFVSAIADSGWVFSYWLLNGSDVGSANPYSLTMDANYNLTAVFVESSVLYSLNVGVSGSGATDPVAGVYTYDAGSSVFVSAIADSGWVFSYWLLNGSDVGSANPYSLTMDANYNLTAVFTETSLIFVDGFESGDLVQWSGVGTWGGAAAPVVESVNPHHGTYNAKSVVSAGQSSFVYKNIDVQSVVYARAYHMWSVNPSAGAESRLVWVFGPGGLIAIGGVRNNNGVLQFYMRYLKNGAYVTLNYNYDFSASKYYSIELYVKVDATGGEAALYIDGVKVLEDSDFGNDDRGSVTQVRVGVDWGSAIGQSWAHEHYWDCVEVSSAFIGTKSST